MTLCRHQGSTYDIVARRTFKPLGFVAGKVRVASNEESPVSICAHSSEAFIRNAARTPFCPSLGELSTTLSHPESTSHRGLTAEQRAALGISGGTIRLSVGTESPEFVVDALAEGLASKSL